MPLGLVPGVRTQGEGWPCQEVHHCTTHVMVANREKISCAIAQLAFGEYFGQNAQHSGLELEGT